MMGSRVFRPSFWYWERCGEERRQGIVVALGWMLSRRKHLRPYTRLYNSSSWDCLACHPQLSNLFFPSKAAILALNILDEILKEIKDQPCPIVFAVFSGGHKSCLYKIIQVLEGSCSEIKCDVEKYKVIRSCLVGVIFDSSPIDVQSDLGAKFVSHQILTLQPGKPYTIISWAAQAGGKTVDLFVGSHLKSQRDELWKTLYLLKNFGPLLLFGSESDELAPLEMIRKFTLELQRLGGDATLISWKESEHVGHFRFHPEEYEDAVRKLLAKSSSHYFRVQNGNETTERSMVELHLDATGVDHANPNVQVSFLQGVDSSEKPQTDPYGLSSGSAHSNLGQINVLLSKL